MTMKVKPDKDIMEIVNLYILDNFIEYDDLDSVYSIVEKAYIDGILAVLENGQSFSGDNSQQQEDKSTTL